MIKSICLSPALLSLILLISAGGASARTGGTLVPTPTGSATQLIAIASSVHPTQVLNIWALPIYMGDGDDNGDRDKDKDKDKDKHEDKDKDDPSPSPTPEPSTILSFGAAILIGGAVLYSRRLRGSRK